VRKGKGKKRSHNFIETQKRALDKFFKNDFGASTNPNNELAVVVAMEGSNISSKFL
jgi:hypothetical protein